jgi:polysaccharide biosynthesis/export protein
MMFNSIVATLMALQLGAPALSPAGSTSNRAADYVVAPQDVLKVTVYDEPQLSGTFRVDADGSFTYPFIGRINAVGETLRNVEAMLTRRLADGYVRNPQVTIEVEHFRTRSIFVVGEVRSPGKYPLTGQMTVIEALAQAGSTTTAAGTAVLILRGGANVASAEAASQTDPETAEVVRVSLTDLQAGQMQENVTLQEGDTIFVPKADRFYVTGHVRSPGAYTYEPGMTVLQALSVAGGVSERGSNRGVKAIRMVNGQKKEVSVKLTDAIQPNDTLVVRQRLL